MRRILPLLIQGLCGIALRIKLFQKKKQSISGRTQNMGRIWNLEPANTFPEADKLRGIIRTQKGSGIQPRVRRRNPI